MKSIKTLCMLMLVILLTNCTGAEKDQPLSKMKESFMQPPETVRPGVYWYFMDGNMTKEGMTKDLESMKEAGIGQVVFLEVNVGVPRGKVDFLSEEWLNIFEHMVRETERLGITITLGVGPGWTGSGGPWVEGSQSMKHLVSSSVRVTDGMNDPIVLPLPEPRNPYFGLNQFPDKTKEKWENYYEDVAVLAFPETSGNYQIDNIDEKALYYREPYTSKPGVKPYLPTRAEYKELPELAIIEKEEILDLTEFMQEDGTLNWEVPKGSWTIMRFVSRNNGAITRPAPMPGVGFEADKFDTAAINDHLKNFTEKLFAKTGVPDPSKQGGLKMLHMDSWEMGAQNWTGIFREEFISRRGYDPVPFFPTYAGKVVESLEISERFLWDLRQTSMELIVENHAEHLKNYAKQYNMGFSIEPYDMNPTADMVLGSVADVPMCEFWSKDYGFFSAWSCIQAASIAHINGNPVVAAEAFTAHLDEWRLYPGSMKNQGDWAFAAGVNRLVYHTFQHQSLKDELKPGMTMGPYGVHHDRNQTWWPMADGYHEYVKRCQFMLQQGKPVADILYLTPEGAPQVFRAPKSAMTYGGSDQKSLRLGDHDNLIETSSEEEIMPDRKAYNFSGCSPDQLFNAKVRDNKIVFPGGAEFHLLVLPDFPTMSPALLSKIEELIKEGATIIGNPPVKSPSLSNYPTCDTEVLELSKKIWGNRSVPEKEEERSFGEGKIIWGKKIYQGTDELYPEYEFTVAKLQNMGVSKDFQPSENLRYIHKVMDKTEFYFVSNKTDKKVEESCTFNVSGKGPEIWYPLNGEIRELPDFTVKNGQTNIQLSFEPYESYFIVFSEKQDENTSGNKEADNFPTSSTFRELEGPWKVSFNPDWGGPENIIFNQLEDWTLHEEAGIKYYSGIAVYEKSIDISDEHINKENKRYFLNTSRVYNLARAFVNGKDMGVIWTAPYQVEISEALVPGENKIEIHVANLWPNRLIGDEKLPEDGIKNNEWPEWVTENKERPTQRYSFTTFKHFKKDDELLTSGLLGPVRIVTQEK